MTRSTATWKNSRHILALLGTAKKVREVTVPVRGTHHSKHMEISKAKKRPSHTFVFFFLFKD